MMLMIGRGTFLWKRLTCLLADDVIAVDVFTTTNASLCFIVMQSGLLQVRQKREELQQCRIVGVKHWRRRFCVSHRQAVGRLCQAVN